MKNLGLIVFLLLVIIAVQGFLLWGQRQRSELTENVVSGSVSLDIEPWEPEKVIAVSLVTDESATIEIRVGSKVGLDKVHYEIKCDSGFKRLEPTHDGSAYRIVFSDDQTATLSGGSLAEPAHFKPKKALKKLAERGARLLGERAGVGPDPSGFVLFYARDPGLSRSCYSVRIWPKGE